MRRAARLAAKKPPGVPSAHRSAGEWRKNADDLVRDPKHPQACPAGTSVPETIVYLPGNLDVAAAKQQITGSVWHGAPTANLISGGILALALPPFGLFLRLRLRRLRWQRAKGFVQDLVA